MYDCHKESLTYRKGLRKEIRKCVTEKHLKAFSEQTRNKGSEFIYCGSLIFILDNYWRLSEGTKEVCPRTANKKIR